MSDYETIKAQCLPVGELWEDPDFPAVQNSVFYCQRPPFHFVWKRPKDIFHNCTFVNDTEVMDVVSGRLGDSWLVSCLGILYLNRGLFHQVVPTDQRLDRDYAGIFRFRIWWCGKWTEVLVDDRLPTVYDNLVFLQSSQPGMLWPALLEKAYAKLHGSYEALKYGNLLDGLADLTGGITETILNNISPITFNCLLMRSSIVTAQYNPQSVEEMAHGLQIGMNYRICRIEKVTVSANAIIIVLLKRPLPHNPKNASLLENALWKSFSPSDKERLMADHRSVWIPYTEFQKTFKALEIVHLDAETSVLDDETHTNAWHMQRLQGSWRRGVSAGGCRNNTSLFHINPQIQVVVRKSDILLVSLSQHCIMEPKVIGFSIYLMTGYSRTTATQGFFKVTKSSVNSQYSNSRQVSHRCQLDPGVYLIVPTTFEPREEAEFTLRVFSSHIKQDIRVLDCIPQILKPTLKRAPPGLEATSFAQYESVFVQLANEHKTVNAFELQELLDACLPNDYIKSCASLDTCKQIVLSLDQTGSNRINLANFKDLMCSLKYWQMIFKNHTREKMGVLRAERLRDALLEVGFVVPEQVLALLVLRFMRKDGMIRFGDFVSAVMHLHRAFNIFYIKDGGAYNGIINLDLTEWLTHAFMC